MEFLSEWPLWNQVLFWVNLVGLIFSVVVLPISEYRVSSANGKRHELDNTLSVLVLAVIWPMGWILMVINEKRKLYHAMHVLGIILGINPSRAYFSGRGFTCNL